MKNVLITGAAGDVGSHLRRELAGKYSLRLSDRRALRPGPGKEEKFVKADISKMPDALKITKGVDAIVHLGGYSVEGPWQAIHEANIVGCYNIFEAARKNKVKRILFATSKDTVLTATDARLEGRLGTVTMAIRAGGAGEIIFTRKSGGRQSVGARSASGEAIAAGSEVVILDYQDGIASVQSWDDFMAAVRAGDLPELAPIETKRPQLPTPDQPKEG